MAAKDYLADLEALEAAKRPNPSSVVQRAAQGGWPKSPVSASGRSGTAMQDDVLGMSAPNAEVRWPW